MVVMTARQLEATRNDTTRFPNRDGGDIVKEFEEQRKPQMRSALQAKLNSLNQKRKTENNCFLSQVCHSW